MRNEMEPTSTKRRKTSPSPPAAMTTERTQSRTHSRDGEPNSSRRASYMSPTKASLARFNPALLSPTKSVESQRPSSRDSDTQGHDVREDTRAGRWRLSDLGISRDKTKKATASGANSIKVRGTPQRKSRTPGETRLSPPSRTEISRTTQKLRASPLDEDRDVLNESYPRRGNLEARVGVTKNGTTAPTSAPSQPNRERDIRQPTTPSNSSLPRVPTGMGQNENGEPSLPSTPVHLGIEKPPERPKGLSYSSPSHRSRTKATSMAKQSPLKPDDPATSSMAEATPHVHKKLGPRLYISNTPWPPPSLDEANQTRLQESIRALEEKLQDVENRLISQNLMLWWHREKSKEKKDIAKWKKEALHMSSKFLRVREELAHMPSDQSMQQGDQIRETSNTSTPPIDTVDPSATSLFMRLDRYLPFSRPSITQNTSRNTENSRQLNIDTAQEGSAPMTIAILDSVLLPSEAGETLQQRQDLVLAAPRQLLRAKLRTSIDVSTQTVDQVQILGLSPWADQELGTWLRALPTDSDIPIIGTAFGRYYELSIDRAQCFLDAEQEFRDLREETNNGKGVEKSHMSEHLGCQDISFARDHVSLDITWLLSFEDDGEVRSKVSAAASFPDAWRRNVGPEIDRIGDAFDLLKEEKGPLEAIRMICKLIFPC